MIEISFYDLMLAYLGPILVAAAVFLFQEKSMWSKPLVESRVQRHRVVRAMPFSHYVAIALAAIFWLPALIALVGIKFKEN